MSSNHAATQAAPPKTAKKRKVPTGDVQATDRPSKFVRLVQNGDVLITAGDGEDTLEIRVSGTVLSLASPVFRTELGSDFTEGRTKEIILKYDDPNVVLDFCRVLHYDFLCIKDWDERRMALIAEMATMRCCTHIFEPHIVPKLSAVINKMADAADDPLENDCILSFLREEGFTFESVMELATKFNLTDLFWNSVKVAIILSPDLIKLESMGPGWNSILEGGGPNDIYGQIKIQERSLVKKCLREIFECLNSNFLPGTDAYSGWHACAQTKLGALTYMLGLEDIKILNLEAYGGTLLDLGKSVSRLEHLADSARRNEAPPPELSPGSHHVEIWRVARNASKTKCRSKACSYCMRNIPAEMLAIVNYYCQKSPGICLLCLKTEGEPTFMDQRCDKHE